MLISVNKLSDLILCVLIRLIFLIQSCFSIYFLVTFYNQYLYLILLFGIIVIIADCLYILLARNGKEFKW